jgi:hypothetical protein
MGEACVVSTEVFITSCEKCSSRVNSACGQGERRLPTRAQLQQGGWAARAGGAGAQARLQAHEERYLPDLLASRGVERHVELEVQLLRRAIAVPVVDVRAQLHGAELLLRRERVVRLRGGAPA